MIALTKRQLEVVDCLADGLENRDIADRLSMSWHTVKGHVRELQRRYGAKNRTHVVALYLIEKHTIERITKSKGNDVLANLGSKW